MTTKLKINGVEYPVYNVAMFDERLDEQIDSGEIQTITNSITPFEDFCEITTEINDGGTVKKSEFFGFDTVEKRGDGYYIHALELVEPSRHVMGVMIDGLKVTQPIDDSNSKKTLKDVLMRVLNTANLLRPYEIYNYGKSFVLSDTFDEDVGELFEIDAPEFNWEAQTLLWECLCEIGRVVNCMPRIVGFKNITFQRINDITEEYEI